MKIGIQFQLHEKERQKQLGLNLSKFTGVIGGTFLKIGKCACVKDLTNIMSALSRLMVSLIVKYPFFMTSLSNHKRMHAWETPLTICLKALLKGFHTVNSPERSSKCSWIKKF